MGIPQVSDSIFALQGSPAQHEFSVRVFKIYSPKSQKSKISLVAHKRSVTETAIHHYIPEFIEEFCDKDNEQGTISNSNYIINSYVFGDYLDHNVALERGGFDFPKESDMLSGITQNDIEKEASIIAKLAVGEDISTRQERKLKRINSYIEHEAPWHRGVLDKIDLSSMPYNPSKEEIEVRLQKEKYNQEISIKKEVSQLLNDNNIDNLKNNITGIISKISTTGKNDLIHYIALRRNVLDIFKKSLELDPERKYSSEGVVHDIIFPRKGDSEKTSFEDHNLWLIDERLNFTNYVSSDLPLNGGNSERPDLLVYNKRVLFRGDNEPSNPITIFEFKKPQRDDFVNPSSKEDPVQQIVRYVNSIREGDFKTPEGREILVAENTAFYGYVVCDLTKKVKKWLETEKDLGVVPLLRRRHLYHIRRINSPLHYGIRSCRGEFIRLKLLFSYIVAKELHPKDFKPMPDRLGWFQWRENINLYIEVISWDKVLKDADMRNKIFFHKLGI